MATLCYQYILTCCIYTVLSSLIGRFVLLSGCMEAKVVIHIWGTLGLLSILRFMLLLIVILLRNADIRIFAQLQIIITMGTLWPSRRYKLTGHDRSSHSLQLKIQKSPTDLEQS